MKLLEALKIIKSPPEPEAQAFPVALCCGFTPLHFETFLKAHLLQVHPEKAIHIRGGLFGDLAGNLDRAANDAFSAVIVALEWSDLDARLGLRSAGGWLPEQLPDMVATARLQLDRIASAIEQMSVRPLVISLPTLPLPPVSYMSPNRLSPFEAELRSHVASFSSRITSCRATVIHPQAVDRVSAPAARFDVKSELLAGFPYTLEHADALAGLAAGATAGRARKKGLITDLDDTLWHGILGDVGVPAVCWSLDQHAQLHGVYQQFLASLAAAGTLIGVASKNDPALVEEAFRREDLLVTKDRIFPLEVHWNAKSQSVARILRAWNISADAVVFVDDSPMEIAEVKAAFPDLTCHLFPKDDPGRFWDLLVELREDFGTSELTNEDTLRLSSLRSRTKWLEGAGNNGAGEQFLSGAEAQLTFSMAKSPDARAFELLNKTNQFNLNGVRLSEADWNALLSDPDRFVLKVSYKDRFGPLGTIAVLAGTTGNGDISIDHWVMSCRAFSRRIEHQCLKWVFDRFQPEVIALNFSPTPRNGPTREFLASLVGEPLPENRLRLSRNSFMDSCPALYHAVVEN
ncbi:MAG: HAD-IIIC family phosphatase [Acidobacteriaceae bacterium]|nr:HAD-IIIC family phosphatase [Acidobacteriaceae bacterium]